MVSREPLAENGSQCYLPTLSLHLRLCIGWQRVGGMLCPLSEVARIGHLSLKEVQVVIQRQIARMRPHQPTFCIIGASVEGNTSRV